MRHQQIDRHAQRRVRADARITVGAAALQADGDVRGAAGLALDCVGLRQHVVDQRNAFRDSFRGAARVLNAEDAQRVAFTQTAVGQPGVDLIRLATESDHQHACEIGVGRVTRQRALQNLHAGAFGVHAAAGAVRQRDHTIDIREFFKCSGICHPGKMVGNRACRRSRTIDARQDADVVARGYAAVFALDAHETGLFFGWLGLHVVTKSVVARKVALVRAHVEVVRVNMLAGGNRFAGKADDLVVAAHRLAGRDGVRGDLVASRDQTLDDDTLGRRTADELRAGDEHIVLGMEADKRDHVVTGMVEKARFWRRTQMTFARRQLALNRAWDRSMWRCMARRAAGASLAAMASKIASCSVIAACDDFGFSK